MERGCTAGCPCSESSMRRMRGILVALVALLAALAISPSVAFAEVDTSATPTGYWGDAPYWENRETKEIVIGNGIPDCNWEARPNFPGKDEYGARVSFQDGVVLPKNCESLFRWCHFKSIDLHNVDFSQVDSIHAMFTECTELQSIDLTGIDFSHVRRASWVLSYCNSLEDVKMSGADFSGLTNEGSNSGMSSFFFYDRNLKSVDMSYCTLGANSYEDMFADDESLEKVDFTGLKVIHSWDGGEKPRFMLSVGTMFGYCKSLESIDLSNFDTAGFEYFDSMFSGCSSLEKVDLGGVDTSAATRMENMFSGCSSLKDVDVSRFDTSNVKTMGSMFKDCSSLESLDLSSFDTSKAEAMGSMLEGCTSLEELGLSDGFFKADAAIRAAADLPDVAEMAGYSEESYSGKWVRTDGSVPSLMSAGLIGASVPDSSSYAGTWIWQGKRTLTYDANGGEGAPAPQTFWYGDSDAVSSEKPERVAYDFTGWNTAANGSGIAVEPGAEIPYMAADGTLLVGQDGLTLYAQWKEQTYTLTYDPAGGVWADGTTESISRTYGKASDPATILDAPTREGYVFVRWEGSSYQPGNVYDKRGEDGLLTDDTLTAVWEKAAAPTSGSTADGRKAQQKADRTDATSQAAMPQTGDTSMMAAPMAVAGIAALAAAVLMRRKIRG